MRRCDDDGGEKVKEMNKFELFFKSFFFPWNGRTAGIFLQEQNKAWKKILCVHAQKGVDSSFSHR